MNKINASLRKSKAPVGDWRKYNGSHKAANPYASLQEFNQPGSGGNSLDIPKVQNHDKHKIKRRLSMKVDNNIVPDLSSMPTLPSSAMAMIAEHSNDGIPPPPGSSGGIDSLYNNNSITNVNSGETFEPRSRSGTKNGSFSVPLADPSFDAHKYVITNLQQAKAAEVDDFTIKLIGLDERIDEDIKNNVNKSYEKILIVSNDLSSTEQELKVLKSTISTLQDITNQMKEVAESRLKSDSQSKGSKGSSLTDLQSLSVPGTMGGRRDRSSVMILERKWVDELNSLFKHVEGAQKLLVASPSRHILAESGRWYELNAATWKPLHPSHIFVLNDHILIATNKKNKSNQGQSRSRLVAEQCWQLREVQLIEIPIDNDDENPTFALNFRFHGSSFIYQTDRNEEFTKILQSFKKAQSQLRDISEQEVLKQRRLRDSMSILSASDKSAKRNSSLLQDLSARMHSRTSNITNSDLIRTLRDIDDMIDEIDINIGHHKFGEAVELIRICDDNIKQKKQGINETNDEATAQEVSILLDVLKMKLEQRQSDLEKALTFEINDELNSTEDITEFIFFLRTLNSTSLAKENLLLARSNLIIKLVQQVDFEGDIPDYITQVSIIRFQIIKNTTQLFQESFPEPEYSSDIIKWCTEEVKKHADLLRKQLFDVKFDSPIYRTCIDITKRQVKDLRLAGLDVDFLLDSVYTDR